MDVISKLEVNVKILALVTCQMDLSVKMNNLILKSPLQL